MITSFNQYIVAQMRNPHQKFEAVYTRDGRLEGVQAVGKFRQFAYATFNKAQSDRVSRELAVALKQLRDTAAAGNMAITGWGKLGHERLTFAAQDKNGQEVNIRHRIAVLTGDRSPLTDAQLERLHKIECGILLVERLAAGAIAEDTISIVSSASAINDALASGNTDHLFRMRTTAERAASKEEVGGDSGSIKLRSKHAEKTKLVVDARLEIVGKAKIESPAKPGKKVVFVDTHTYGTFKPESATASASPKAHKTSPKATSNGEIHAKIFGNRADDVTYATVQAQVFGNAERIPEEDEEEFVPEATGEPTIADKKIAQAALNRRVEAEVKRLYATGELKRATPAAKPVTVSDPTATYASVSRPDVPARTEASHILKPAVAPKPTAKPMVLPPLPPKAAPAAAPATEVGTYDKGDEVAFAPVPSREQIRRAEALAKLAGK